MSELAGRRALVTGGGGAIGRVALRALLDMGAEEMEELAGAFRLLLVTSYMQGASLRVDGGWTAV